MATQTLANADAILKDDYTGPLVEQLNQKQYILEYVKRETEMKMLDARRAIVPLHTGRNRGRNSSSSGGTLPTPGRQEYQDAIVSIRYHRWGIEIEDGLVTAATGSNAGAFINALDAEVQGVANDSRKDMCRQIYGDGTGLLGTAASNAAGVVTMGSKQDVQYIGVGDTLDLVVKSTGATTNGVVGTTVTAISVSSKTVTVSPAPAGAVDNTYGFYIAGSRNNESDGLRNISNTGRTLHNINSSTAGNEFWNGQQTDIGSSVTALTLVGETNIEKLDDDIGSTGNAEVTAFISTRGIVRRLADQYQSQKRFNDAQAVKIAGGYTGITVNGKPLIKDDDCPKTYVFAVTPDALKWYEQAPPGWMDLKGAGVFHLKDGSTAGSKQAIHQAWFRWYVALVSPAPNRLGQLRYCLDDTATSGA